MPVMSARQVYALARGVGLAHDQAVTATAVAAAESHLDPDAIGDVSLEDAVWGPSVGLWQIRSVKRQRGSGGVRDASHLSDPMFNARSMAAISNGGHDFGAWSTYTSGAYAGHVKAVQRAVGDGSKVPQGKAPRGTMTTDSATNVANSGPLDGPHSWVTGPDPGDLVDGAEGGLKLLGKGLGAIGRHDAKQLGKDAQAAAGALWDMDAVRTIVVTSLAVLGGVMLILAGTAAAARGAES